MTAKTILVIGALFSGLGVMIGAFGAHGLQKMLETTGRTATFETAVKYQMYHSLALLLIGILMVQFPQVTGLKTSGLFFLIGILIFSGSLYILCLTGVRWMGAITPIGGVFMIVGWVYLAWLLAKNL